HTTLFRSPISPGCCLPIRYAVTTSRVAVSMTDSPFLTGLAETPSYQNLHRELLLSHKRGLLLEEKPELKRVLEQRRLELHKEEELAQRRPSDLEMELRKRQLKLEEQEAIRQQENQQKIPEFVRVKDNLRRTQMSEQ
uniref:Uncharacterized protein n=1 Tax=Mola mola TaxID=94237 RepID=A0A3Q3VSP1_MOLML